MSGQAKRKRITAAQRMKVWQKYNGHCAYCGCEIMLEEMQVDHIVSAGAKIVAKNQSGSRSSGKKKHRTRLTEISRGSGKAIISDGVTVNQAIKKLHDYEDTGLSPQAVRNLIEREKNLTEKILKMQDW